MTPRTAAPVDDLVGLTVDEIARQRGVTKRYAYALHRRVNAPAVEADVPTNQKAAILRALESGYAATMAELQEKTRVLGGMFIDIHALTHVVWSLQKQRLVRFRERKSAGPEAGAALTTIKMTNEGRTYLASIRSATTASAVIVAPEPNGLSAFPHLRDLRERAKRVLLIQQAVSLLEQAGEDGVALDLLERHSLTDEEREMVRLLDTLETTA